MLVDTVIRRAPRALVPRVALLWGRQEGIYNSWGTSAFAAAVLGFTDGRKKYLGYSEGHGQR